MIAGLDSELLHACNLHRRALRPGLVKPMLPKVASMPVQTQALGRHGRWLLPFLQVFCRCEFGL